MNFFARASIAASEIYLGKEEEPNLGLLNLINAKKIRQTSCRGLNGVRKRQAIL